MRILFFGDSITQGFTDPTGGWVRVLNAPYLQGLLDGSNVNAPDCFNLGVSADTSRNVCDRFQNETKVRKRSHELVFVFAVGVNDACIANGKMQVPPEEYRANISELIDMARAFSDKILFVGLTPCVEAKTDPCPWGDYVYRNDDIKKLDDILRDTCQEHELPYVAVSDSFVGRETELLSDGLHPNTEGHKVIADLVKPELEKLMV